jgi:hypothetical protein
VKSREDSTGLSYSVKLTAETTLDISAIEFHLDLPRPAFVMGTVLPRGGVALRLTAVKPASNAFYRGETNALRLQDASSSTTLDVGFDTPLSASIIDRWDAQGRSVQVRAVMAKGLLQPKTEAALTVDLRLTRRASQLPPVRIVLDSSHPTYRFGGFGGNFCWDNQSPISAYMRKNLNIAWARTEMKLLDWDKQRGNPGPAIRADLEAMSEFQKRGIPYVISIWWLPERFYTDPFEKPRMAPFRLIDGEKWDELLDLIGSYLLYAKREYGAEPDLFSFNEANIGIYVGLTPETHSKVIKRIGTYFQKQGLKTKMLLGDATGPRDTHKFVLEATSDPEAMQFVGAVGFHSWEGGTSAHYMAWGDVAEWLNLPLLVTELGVDSQAYYTHSWDSYQYGLREARMTLELLQYARPRGTLFWQFTNDYALARLSPDGAVSPTGRFWLMKHFTDLTPQHSEALTITANQPSVLTAAFRAGNRYAVHVLNLGASRPVSFEGLPAADWQLTQTTETAGYGQQPASRTPEGKLSLTLPARSLITLTAEAVTQR